LTTNADVDGGKVYMSRNKKITTDIYECNIVYEIWKVKSIYNLWFPWPEFWIVAMFLW